MTIFDVAAILVAVAAASGYVNHRLLRLPPTSGTLLVALGQLARRSADRAVHAGRAIAACGREFRRADRFRSDPDARAAVRSCCSRAHCTSISKDSSTHRWTIAALATVGVLLSVAVVGGLTWLALNLLGVRLPLLVCLTFGALISPTDPIAVMGLLKEMRAPQSLEAQIAGESLFNDGIGVVVFLALASMAGLSGTAGADAPGMNRARWLSLPFGKSSAALDLGLAFGYCGYRALKSIDDHPLELLITLGTGDVSVFRLVLDSGLGADRGRRGRIADRQSWSPVRHERSDTGACRCVLADDRRNPERRFSSCCSGSKYSPSQAGQMS